MKLHKTLAGALEKSTDVLALKLTLKRPSFPRELFDLPNLRELYLEGTCSEWPDETLPWKELRVLSLKLPGLQGSIASVFGLPQLVNLKLLQTPLRALLLPLGHIPAPLKSLTLKDCGLRELPQEISLLTHLSELNLSGNKLQKLPEGFVDLPGLSRLNLDHNQFERFPDLVKKMATLTHLSIDRNLFSEEEKERIQREFHVWVE